MYETIRTAIINVINSESERVAEAYRTDRSQLDKYPAAIVTPSEQQADYNETAPSSSKETYVFTIRLHYPFTEGQDTADIALEKAIDELISIFRDKTILGSVADWIQPVPSVWGYQDRGNGIMRVAEFKIRAVKYVG